MSLALLFALTVATVLPLAERDTSAPGITGPESATEHTIITHSATDLPAKAGTVWRIVGTGTVSRAVSPRGVVQWTASPGEYAIELLVIELKADGTTEVLEVKRNVKVVASGPKVPPKKATETEKAVGRIMMGNSGCTATVIYPRRPDGRWDVLTAAHCTASAKMGRMTLKDGRSFTVTVTARDTAADVCWLVTDDIIEELPSAVLASEVPPMGTAVWQAGYGTNQPGVRKDGELIGPALSGQLLFALSVSHGDSGGGIFNAATGEVIACVCCTTAIARKVNMYGGSCIVAWKMRPNGNVFDNWQPMPIPIK